MAREDEDSSIRTRREWDARTWKGSTAADAYVSLKTDSSVRERDRGGMRKKERESKRGRGEKEHDAFIGKIYPFISVTACSIGEFSIDIRPENQFNVPSRRIKYTLLPLQRAIIIMIIIADGY